MPSLRSQLYAVVKGKLDDVLADLDWETVLVNPREPVGSDQMNAIGLVHGGDPDPRGLTGHVARRQAEFTVFWMVRETADATAEELLDLGYVAISDALLDPDDIQLGGLAIAIEQLAVSEPVIGRAADDGARILGGQAMDFVIDYLAREGDASTAAP